MISLQGMEEEFDRDLAIVEPEEGPKVNIPWEKIDEWIATIEIRDEPEREARVVDPGDRRN